MTGAIGQIIEFRDSRLMCYHLHLKVVAGSVPCSATTIQRPTVLGWVFLFAESACRAGFPPILRVPADPPVGGMTGPVRPCSALSSLETCANFFAVAHAGGVFRQWFVRVPMGMVGSRVCCSRLPVQTREASPNISPWAGTDHDRSCCAGTSSRARIARCLRTHACAAGWSHGGRPSTASALGRRNEPDPVVVALAGPRPARHCRRR